MKTNPYAKVVFIRHTILYTLVFIYSQNTFSQNLIRDISLYGHSGKIVETNEFLGGKNTLNKPIKNYKAISAHLGFNINRDEVSKKVYKNASYGIGLQITSFKPHKDLGIPYSIYGFIQTDIFRYQNLNLRFNGELGLAQNWNQRSANNSLNDAISLARTVHIDIGVDLNYRITSKHNVGASLSVAHFSNAAVKRPNQGINTITPKLIYSFIFNEQNKSNTDDTRPSLSQKRNNFAFNLTAGYHNYSASILNDSLKNPYKGVNVRVFGINMNYSRALNPILKIGFGADLLWDEGLTLTTKIIDSTLVNINTESSSNFESSIYPILDIRFYKISLSIQQGLYIYRQSNNYNLPRTYQRLGILYHLSNRITVGAYLRAYNFKSANFMEVSFGLNF